MFHYNPQEPHVENEYSTITIDVLGSYQGTTSPFQYIGGTAGTVLMQGSLQLIWGLPGTLYRF